MTNLNNQEFSPLKQNPDYQSAYDLGFSDAIGELSNDPSRVKPELKDFYSYGYIDGLNSIDKIFKYYS